MFGEGADDPRAIENQNFDHEIIDSENFETNKLRDYFLEKQK